MYLITKWWINLKRATIAHARKKKGDVILRSSLIVLLPILLLPLATYTMDVETEQNVAALPLLRKKSELYDLPEALGKTVAQYILDGHPIVSYILAHIPIPNLQLEGHTNAVVSAVFNEQGNQLATRSNHKALRLWDTVTGIGEEIQTKGYEDICRSGSRLLLAGSSGDKSCSLYDLESGKLLFLLEGHEEGIHLVKFSGTGTKIITASVATVKLWDALTGECLQTFVAKRENSDFHEPNVTWFLLSPNEDKIAIFYENRPIEQGGDYERTIKLWDCKTGVCLPIPSGSVFKGIGAETFTIFERTIPTIYDVGTDERLRILIDLGSLFTASDKVALATEKNSVMIWDLKANECIQQLEGHTDTITEAAFCEGGDKLMTCQSPSGMRSMKLWDLKTNRCICTGECPAGPDTFGRPLLTDPKMSKMVTVSVEGLKIWDLKKNICIHTIPSCIDPIISFDDRANKIVTESTDQTPWSFGDMFRPTQRTLSVWDSALLFDCHHFLEKEVSLPQAIILNAIYEVMILPALVKKRHANAAQNLTSDATEEREQLLKQVNELVLDFKTFSALEESYDAMPEAIKRVLNPFVKRSH